MLTTTVEGPVTHLCPYREERDIGRFKATFDGEASDIHLMLERVGYYANREITHEELTVELADHFGTRVETMWMTGGAVVTCVAEP